MNSLALLRTFKAAALMPGTAAKWLNTLSGEAGTGRTCNFLTTNFFKNFCFFYNV